MKLTKTQPIVGSAPTAAVSSAPIKPAQFEEEEEDDSEGLFNGLSVGALVASIAALFVVLLGYQKVKPFYQESLKGDAAWEGNWEKSGVTKDWKIPAEYNPFAKQNKNGTWTNDYPDKKKKNYSLPVSPHKESKDI